MFSFVNKDLNFTKSEKKLVDYVMSHRDEVIYSSITELSKLSGIGNATIVRFCKKVGFKGFPDFKVALAHDLSSERSNVFSGPIAQEDSLETIARKFYNVNVEALDSTMEQMDYDSIRQAAGAISRFQRLHFAGIGHSAMTAQETKYKLMRVGFHADTYMDEHTMLMTASIMNEEDLVFVISHSGATKEIVRMLETAQENYATTICVTGNQESPAAELADITVDYVSPESLFQTGAVSTKMAQLFVIDLIYTEVIRLAEDIAVEKKKKTTQIVQSSRKDF